FLCYPCQKVRVSHNRWSPSGDPIPLGVAEKPELCCSVARRDHCVHHRHAVCQVAEILVDLSVVTRTTRPACAWNTTVPYSLASKISLAACLTASSKARRRRASAAAFFSSTVIRPPVLPALGPPEESVGKRWASAATGA